MNLIDKAIESTEFMAKAMAGFNIPGSIRADVEGIALDLETFRWIREEAGKGKPLITSFFRTTLSRGMGFVPVPYPLFIMNLGDRAKEYRQLVGSIGIPGYGCDHLILPNIAILSGDAPKPSFIVPTFGECPAVPHGFKFVADAMGIPEYSMDVPVYYGEENIKYLADQIGGLVEYIEAKVPGIRYDRDRHLEMIELDGICYREAIKQWRLRANVPFPFTNTDSYMNIAISLLRLPSVEFDLKKAVELAKRKTEEMMELAASVPPENIEKQKLRLFNVLAGPMHVNPFAVSQTLESRNAVLVGNFAGPTSHLSGRRGVLGDEEEFGRKLSPFEEEARMILGFSFKQPGDTWLDEILWCAKFLKANAIIVEQWTDCVCTNSLTKIVADSAEKELGIPAGVISHKMLDQATLSQEDYLARLSEFLDIALEAQHA